MNVTIVKVVFATIFHDILEVVGPEFFKVARKKKEELRDGDWKCDENGGEGSDAKSYHCVLAVSEVSQGMTDHVRTLKKKGLVLSFQGGRIGRRYGTVKWGQG